nr:TonB-dependent receptor [Bacteroidales bacterium]
MNIKTLFLTFFLIFIFLFISLPPVLATDNKTNHTLSGYMKDAANGEVLIGATIFVKEIKNGVVTNSYGFYSLSLPEGKYNIIFSMLGYKNDSLSIVLDSDKKHNVELKERPVSLSTVNVVAEKANANITRNEMSVEKLDIKTIKQIPALMGEVDIIKAIQMLPGVQATSEGTSGFSVRGGSFDQNLILLDEATVYNASHLMGFFSVFNNDAIKDVKLYKGDIPAEYGSRLASVLDVRMKEGNNKNICFTGGIGLISSRLTAEGPLADGKTSFLVSARRTYADIFFPLFPDTNLKKSTMYFYDLNLKINRELNSNNRLFLSAYSGRDIFGQGKDATIGFGNETATLRWNHLFSSKLFCNLTAVYARYNYSLQMKQGAAEYFWESTLLDYNLKWDFNYYINPDNEIKYGISAIYHNIDPCNAWMKSAEGSKISVPYPKKYALEYAAFISNNQKINDKLSLKYGLRYSIFQNIGKGELYKFDSDYNETGKEEFSKAEIFNTYQNPEPRFGLNYLLNEISSVKAGYTRSIQYMQLATNSTGGMPLDVWFPCSPNVNPQKADQLAIGYFRNFYNNSIESSVETYYKKMYDVIDFKDHPELLMNPRMEGEIRTGSADAYGIELMVKKNNGKLTGWVSYTLSKVTRKIPAINDGKRYPAPYDKPNNINIILSYQLNNKTSFSANWIYASGAPITFPVASFFYNNTYNKIYSSRNGYRMRDYHRLDLSVTIKGKEKPGRLWQGEWVFSVYNAYGRHNDWIINFTQDENHPEITKAERWYLPF